MLITRRSELTGALNTMELDITDDQIREFNKGALVQIAFPKLTPDQREFIISGITADEWNTVFGAEEAETLQSITVDPDIEDPKRERVES